MRLYVGYYTMNIFESLKLYAEKWSVKETRSFTPEEIKAIDDAVVVASEYGSSACFFMVGGGQCYIPLSIDATVGVGESIDVTKAKLITLGRRGDDDIMRVSI